MQTVTKQSGDELDYDVDFSRWIPDGATITTAVAALDIVGELVVQSVQLATPIVKVWLADGVNGKTYKVTVTIATNLGQTKETEFRMRIKDL